MLLGQQTLDETLVAAAFSHVRAKAIQPFLDGNKRSSRVEASFLIATKIQRFPSWGNQSDYVDAMGSAHRGDLTRLVNLLRRGLELSEVAVPIKSPFRIRPFLEGDGVYRHGLTPDELLALSEEYK
jgi:fido (protein-threonine AMPylation protein)